MSSNHPVDPAAVVSDAPFAEAPEHDEASVPHELQQAEQSDASTDDGATDDPGA